MVAKVRKNEFDCTECLVNKAAFNSSRGDIVDISDPFVYLNSEVYMS